MSTTTNDGGPAFPSGDNDTNAPYCQGMSLRDWFAGQVLAGSCANTDLTERIGGFAEKHGLSNQQVRASYCYEIADAMLKARENKA